MRVLVTAATKHGATGEIARAIGEVLAEHGLDTTVLAPEQVDTVNDYDAVVLGSAVYAGHWLKPARELVDRTGDVLAARPVWLFSSGPVGDPPKPEEDPVDVGEILQTTKARDHRVFEGKLVKQQLSSPRRRSSRPCGYRRETSETGPRSRVGRQRSPTPCGPAPEHPPLIAASPCVASGAG